MKNVTITYNRQMKMSDLIDVDYKLLLLLTRLKFSLGFGDKSVDSVCKQNNFDTDCFLFLVNFQTNKCVSDVESSFNKLPLEPFLYYLKCSHEYFLQKRLPNIRRKLTNLFSEEETELKDVVLDFFDVYTQEVYDHMIYEDITVFPYVRKLLEKKKDVEYSIDIFEERHNDIENKMTDLKRILLKYISGVKDQDLMTNILLDLYMSEEELSDHTYIEDNLVIPRVRALEH